MKQKLADRIDKVVEAQLEYETEGDGLDNYYHCFEASHLQPDAKLIICRALALRSGAYRDAMDVVHNVTEADFDAGLVEFILENLDECCDVVYSPGYWVTHEEQCLHVDSAAIGEIEVQPFGETKVKPLFREWYNKNGEYYMSDAGYVYATCDGAACYKINLDSLTDLVERYDP